MTLIHGKITTRHQHARVIAESLAPDNLMSMQSCSHGKAVVTTIDSDRIRSVVASVDDYLTNLAIAEDLCNLVSS